MKFHDCLKAIKHLKKKQEEKEKQKTSLHQEKTFNKNRWKFSKKAVSGNLDQDIKEVGFSCEEANRYYPNTYSTPPPFDTSPTCPLNWFPHLPVNPTSSSYTPFNTQPLRPKDIKNILKSSNLKSSPGPDGIPYSILYKFDSLHHILATLYNRILITGATPHSWSESVVKLIHKKGPVGDPKNFRMIALTSCIGKTYHLLLAKRFTFYLTSNNYLDSTLQKAFLPGINGCIEHNYVLDEIIQNAKTKKRTTHITFFDLEDAFGSVPHPLILHSLRRFHFPAVIQFYINNLYTNQSSRVFTKTFSTAVFPFKKGVFQGDPLSPIIFLMVFNPVIEYLQSELGSGYDLDGQKFITLPYADDFCLITTNKRTHQRIMTAINSKIDTMGMKLKPVKCRSFSIKSGSPSDLNFQIGENIIPTIFHEEQKFLGKVLFPFGKSSDTYKYIHSELLQKLSNLDAVLIRDEFKLWIYKNYLLPSVRFILTIHDLTKSDLKHLDVFTDKYVKKWTGVPPSATNAMIHMKAGLDIPSITQLYRLTHCLAHCRTRLQGDDKVNHALDIKLTRESRWTKKQSITKDAEQQFLNISPQNTDLPPRKLLIKVKDKLSSENETMWLNHIKSLVKQGHFLLLATEEKNDMIWKSYMFDLKKSTLKFLLNSCLDTLPTQVNLCQWGKSTSDLCKLCLNADPPLQGQKRETLQHSLNSCSTALKQGRFTWRHDNIIKYICQCIDKTKYTLYADVHPYSLANGGTIPPNLLVTPLRPDIVILSGDEVNIFELTVPLEPNIKTAHDRKREKYSHLETDISSHIVNLEPFEIGSRGYISKENKSRLNSLHKLCDKTISFTTFRNNISSLAVLSSYYIFMNRRSQDWDEFTPSIRPCF